MRFSKTTDYALRIMVALAIAGDSRLSLHTLSKNEKIPRKFLEHVIRTLREAGLIRSSSGPKGGYQLAHSPGLISLARILQVIQGPFLPMESIETANISQHLRNPIERLQNVVHEIRSYAIQQLAAITLADLVQIRVDEAHKTLMYYI